MVIVPQAGSGEAPLADRSFQLLLIDRQPLFLAAMGELLSSPPLDAMVITATDSSCALELLNSMQIDLVVCEVGARPLSGLTLVGALKKAGHPAPVVLLGGREEGSELLAALNSGASGFFTKETSWPEFSEGLQAIRAGHFAVGRDLAGQALGRMASEPGNGQSRDWRALSATEKIILTMVGQAQSLDAIAISRGVSKKTVRNHLAAIYRKLELKSRTEAMLWAVRTGLVDGAVVATTTRD